MTGGKHPYSPCENWTGKRGIWVKVLLHKGCVDFCSGKSTGGIAGQWRGEISLLMLISSYWLALAHTVNRVSLTKLVQRDNDSIFCTYRWILMCWITSAMRCMRKFTLKVNLSACLKIPKRESSALPGYTRFFLQDLESYYHFMVNSRKSHTQRVVQCRIAGIITKGFASSVQRQRGLWWIAWASWFYTDYLHGKPTKRPVCNWLWCSWLTWSRCTWLP